MMNVRMDATGERNGDGEHLFTVTLDDGNSGPAPTVTSTAQALREMGTRIAQLADSAAQWEATQ